MASLGESECMCVCATGYSALCSACAKKQVVIINGAHRRFCQVRLTSDRPCSHAAVENVTHTVSLAEL